MTNRTCLSIILAAGEGTRMKSALPKVLHPIAGLPLVGHVINATKAAGAGDIALVIGHGAEHVGQVSQELSPGLETYFQEKRLGTADAVLAARKAIEKGYDDVLVVFGDTPLLNPEDLGKARQKLAEGHSVVVMGFRTEDPAGYGRLIEKDGRLLAIREAKDCNAEEININFLNGGLMAIDGRLALGFLDKVESKNAKGEFYLTDVVEIANAEGKSVTTIEVGFDSVLGINNRAELADAEHIWQQRKRRELMLSGVTLLAPETVFMSHDTEIGQDTLIEQNVVFAPGAKIAGGVVIHAFSHIEGATVASGASVGPYARLRPGAELHEKAKVGNFVEIKKAVVEKGGKVNHLSYIGDARVGAEANIGAGVITCNYDGYNKFFTDIGAGAFVGSNSSLVAPIKLGDGAYIASGSVITQEVEADALAFGRARQATLPGKGKQLRELRASIAKK